MTHLESKSWGKERQAASRMEALPAGKWDRHPRAGRKYILWFTVNLDEERSSRWGHLAKPWFQPDEIWSRKSGHSVPRLWPTKMQGKNICIVLNNVCGHLLDSRRRLGHTGCSQVLGIRWCKETIVVWKRGLGSKFLTEKSIRWLNSYLKSQIKVSDVTSTMEHFRGILHLLLLLQIFEFR